MEYPGPPQCKPSRAYGKLIPPDTSRSPPPLLSRCFANVSLLEPQDTPLCIMGHLLGPSRVNNERDIVYSN